jgi:hypothetical protein
VQDIPDGENSVLVASKPHLGYYGEINWLRLPVAETLDELKEALLAHGSTGPLYLYFGSSEAKYRPKFAYLRYGDSGVPWLTPLASGPESGGWALYTVLDPG